MSKQDILRNDPLVQFDEFEHYTRQTGPTDEFGGFAQTPPNLRNIGWTLGNDCP
jgi:hypothetical protein